MLYFCLMQRMNVSSSGSSFSGSSSYRKSSPVSSMINVISKVLPSSSSSSFIFRENYDSTLIVVAAFILKIVIRFSNRMNVFRNSHPADAALQKWIYGLCRQGC